MKAKVLSLAPGRIGIFATVLLLTTLTSAQFVCAQGGQNRGRQNQAANSGDDGIEILPVQGNVYMVAGAGSNIAVQVGPEGIILVDSGIASMTPQVIAAIQTVSKEQVTYIINTDDRDEHTGGNAAFAKLGRPVAINRASGLHVIVVGFNTLLDRMSAPTGQATSVPEEGWPTDSYDGPQKNLFFNGEAVQIFHQPSTTDGNSFVFFRHSEVVATGEMFNPTQYPVIDVARGGSIQGVIEGLTRLKDIVVPAAHSEDGTMIIPGNGRISDAADLGWYWEMVTIVRDRLQDMIKRGMTLEQVKAAKPTLDFDPIYGSNTGTWTTDMFVEAAYKSLTAKPKAGAKMN